MPKSKLSLNLYDFLCGLTIGCKFKPKYEFFDKVGTIAASINENKIFSKIEIGAANPFATNPLRLSTQNLELIIHPDNFILNYTPFINKKLKENFGIPSKFIIDGVENQITELTEDYNTLEKMFTSIFFPLFNKFAKILQVKSVTRIGLVNYFLIPYEKIRMKYITTLFEGASIGKGKNVEKSARNIFRFDDNPSNFEQAIIEFGFPDSDLPTKLGIFKIDYQFYFKDKPKSISDFGGAKNIAQELFGATKSLINTTKCFRIEGLYE